MAKEYWFCIVGPVDGEKLPNGADSILRMPIREAEDKLEAFKYKNEEIRVSSGWGISKKQAERIHDILNEEIDPAIHENRYPKSEGELSYNLPTD